MRVYRIWNADASSYIGTVPSETRYALVCILLSLNPTLWFLGYLPCRDERGSQSTLELDKEQWYQGTLLTPRKFHMATSSDAFHHLTGQESLYCSLAPTYHPAT
jgi:hypothetical protein